MISPIITIRQNKVTKHIKYFSYLTVLLLIFNVVLLYRLFPETLLNFSQSFKEINYGLLIAALAILLCAFIWYIYINKSIKLYCKKSHIVDSFFANGKYKLDYNNLPQKERILMYCLYKNRQYSFILQIMIMIVVELGFVSAIITQNAASFYIYALITFVAIKKFQPKLQNLIEKVNRKAYLHFN